MRYRAYYVVFLPVAAYFIIFHYIPMYGVVIAFKTFNISKGLLGSPWADPLWLNFQRAFSSQIFQRAFRNTVIISILKSIVAFPAPVVFALLLDELPFTRYKKVVQTISYIPHFISWVILGGIISKLLSPSTGAVNYLITLFGGQPRIFMGDPSAFRPIVLISHIWQSIGWGAIVYLAAIAGIDQEQYESARIDGASRLALIRYITLPCLVPVISILFTLGLAGVLSAGFDQIFNLYNATTYSTGDIIDTYVYRVGLIGMEYGYSTAVGLFKNIVGLILVLSTNAIVRRIDPESALF
jgi:putative aldouronate transport system permease protein